MKKIFGLFCVLALTLFSCKDDCKDINCINGGGCSEGTCICPDGYEGDVCQDKANAKFVGVYDVDYTGTGDLSNSSGTTTATVSSGDIPEEIEIDVEFDVALSVSGIDLDVPVEVNIVASVEGNEYYIPETTINMNVDIGGFAIPVNITFEINGILDDNTLTSVIDMSGTANGKINMTGTK